MRYGNGSGIVGGGFPGAMTSIFGGILMVLIIALLVVILIFVLKMYKSMNNNKYAQKNVQNSFVPPTSPALQVLNERLAKGEISEEEYANKKALLFKQ